MSPSTTTIGQVKQKKAKAWLSDEKGGIGIRAEVSAAAGNKSGYEVCGLLQAV